MKSLIRNTLTTIYKIIKVKLLWLIWIPGLSLLILSTVIFCNRSGKLDLYRGPLKLTNIQPDGEASNVYTAITGLPDWNAVGRPSDQDILEDGRRLPGSGNVPREEIQRREPGCYLVSEDRAYFSTSDNSDPRTNGRKYSVRTPLRIDQNKAIFLYSISTLAFFLCLMLTYQILYDRWSTPVRVKVIAGLFTLSVAILVISAVLNEARIFPETFASLWNREVVTEIQSKSGNAFWFARQSPKERTEQAYSVAVLTENGKPLGPGNSIHENIRKEGGGAFSVWKETLIFSTSDNSDPRQNHRIYELFTPPGREMLTISIGVATVANFLLLLTLLLTLRRSHADNFASRSKIGLLAIPWFLFLGVQIFLALPYDIHSRIRTWIYVRNFDVARSENRGTDFCNFRFGEKVTMTRVNEIRWQLRGVSRSRALRGIFDKVTIGAVNDTQKHLQIVKFLQRANIHNEVVPSYPNGMEIFDPLVMLELSEMWCNQASKLAIDLFEAGGYKGRQVQLGGHMIAEIFYDNSWHYLDADQFGNGEIVLTDQGIIPSVIELGTPKMVEKLDGLASLQEELTICCDRNSKPVRVQQLYYPSFSYFSNLAYQKQPERPGYYYKDTPIAKADDHTFYYGWMDFHFEPDPSIIRSNLPKNFVPLAPTIENLIIDRHSGQVTIAYRSTDPDQDLAGYRIYVSERSRGWNYNQFRGRPDLMKYQSTDGKWSPDNYESLFKLPASDVALIEVPADKNETIITLRGKKMVFISIMPFDEYGKSIGRRLFPLSSELKIELE
jgi:hypothetical protein